MLGAFGFGQGYFGQGPMIVLVVPPVTADVDVRMQADVGTIVMAADIGEIVMLPDVTEMEPL